MVYYKKDEIGTRNTVVDFVSSKLIENYLCQIKHKKIAILLNGYDSVSRSHIVSCLFYVKTNAKSIVIKEKYDCNRTEKSDHFSKKRKKKLSAL